MCTFAQSRLERIYLQMESTYGTIPNSSGTATVADGDAVRHVKATLDNLAAVITRPDKTGTRSKTIGQAGRKSGKWSFEASLAPNGTAGTEPDFDPLMQCLMGQAGSAITGSVTVTGATNATPIVISATNTFADGDCVYVSGVTGNTNANGIYVITAVSGSAFTLLGSEGNGTYGSGGTASRVGYKYTLADAILSCSMWSFRQGSALDQRVSGGSVVTSGTFSLGGDVATVSFEGESRWVLSSNQFASESTIPRMGLTSFPTEPSAPVTNGNMIVGFTGLVVVNGVKVANLKTATIRNSSGNLVIKDQFGSYYPTCPEGDERSVGIQFSLDEDETAGLANLITIAHNKTPVRIVIVQGTVRGNTVVHVLNNVQLEPPTRDESLRYSLNFPEAMAKASSVALRDEHVVYFM